MVQYDFGKVRAVFTDLDGVLLGRNPGNYSNPWNALKEGSLESMRVVGRHLESGRRPDIWCAVTGTARPLVQDYLKFMGIKHGTYEHGLAISLNNEHALPLYEYDKSYLWVKPVVEQLAEVRKKIQADRHSLSCMIGVHPNQIDQEQKDFMVAIIPNEIPYERVVSALPEFLDGILDLKKVTIKYSHGAVDFRIKNISKYDGAEVVRVCLGLNKDEIIAIEDNDSELFGVGGFKCCPSISSDPVLEDVRKAKLEGKGQVLEGDYKNKVIEKLLNLVG